MLLLLRAHELGVSTGGVLAAYIAYKGLTTPLEPRSRVHVIAAISGG